MMQKRPRQTDVAKLAGVSPATVSVILNNRLDGNVRIGAETRARVLAAVEQLGYVTDPVARSLAGGRNSLLGVFTFEPIFPLQQRDFYYPFLVGIEQEAEQSGYDLLLFTSIRSIDGHRRIYQGNINRLRVADGAILLGSEQSKEELRRLVADRYPFIFVGRRELADTPISYVAADYATATAKIVAEMLACGHQQIVYLGALNENESHRDRYTGYLVAHRQLGLSHLVATAQRIGAQVITPAFLQQELERGITAFVLESGGSLIAPFFQAMTTLGKCAPADFSLAVLGDPLTDFVAPYPVVSFTIPREAMGRRAVQLLTELLQTPYLPQMRQETLACTYSPGVTIAPPAFSHSSI
jgi:DNA-binding LacI/PurR family transcriptional regulator